MLIQILDFLRGNLEQSWKRGLLNCLPDVEWFNVVNVAGALNCIFQ
jgi:hypothetical protein